MYTHIVWRVGKSTAKIIAAVGLSEVEPPLVPTPAEMALSARGYNTIKHNVM